MTIWRKSTYSHDNGCVSVAVLDGVIAVRDDKELHGPILRFSRTEMAAWIAGVKAGEFDDLVCRQPHSAA